MKTMTSEHWNGREVNFKYIYWVEGFVEHSWFLAIVQYFDATSQSNNKTATCDLSKKDFVCTGNDGDKFEANREGLFLGGHENLKYPRILSLTSSSKD